MKEIPKKLSEEEIALLIIRSGGVDIKDVDAGEKPFLYSSGNYGPGYVDVKGRVGWDDVFEKLTNQSALRLLEEKAQFDFIAGNATGGIVPAYKVKLNVSEWTGRDVPYVYVRNTRKLGGHQEYITGLKNNPHIPEGAKPLIFEELVNFADTTCNSRLVLAALGHVAIYAGTILEYNNPMANERLKKECLILVSTIKLPALLDVAEENKIFSSQAIAGFREFLRGPKEWMSIRGIKKMELPNG